MMSMRDFPFGRAMTLSCWRMIIATMLAVMLLPVSLVSSAYAYTLAQIPSPEMVDKVANKDLSWWFIALALFSISSWTVVVRWLLTQLVEQRKTNAESNSQLVAYMRDDHARTQVLLEKVEQSHNRLTMALDKIGVQTQ